MRSCVGCMRNPIRWLSCGGRRMRFGINATTTTTTTTAATATTTTIAQRGMCMRRVPSPSDGWRPGDGVASSGPKVAIDLEDASLSTGRKYGLLIGTIVPRPIAFVTSRGNAPDAALNVAPFSCFNYLSSNPPSLMISCTTNPDGSAKHTLTNILERREFVVHTCNQAMANAVSYCAAPFAANVSEVEAAGFDTSPSTKVSIPRLEAAPVAFECRLLSTTQVGPEGEPGSATVVVGQIVMMHVLQSAYVNGRVQPDTLENIARMGGSSYTKVTELFDVTPVRVSKDILNGIKTGSPQS